MSHRTPARQGQASRYIHKLRLESCEGAAVKLPQHVPSHSPALGKVMSLMAAAVLVFSAAFALAAGLFP